MTRSNSEVENDQLIAVNESRLVAGLHANRLLQTDRAARREDHVITVDHTPADWQPANLINRRSHDELMAIARARVVAPKVARSDAKPNLGRSNKKRTHERVASLHSDDGRQRLAVLEALVLREHRAE